MRPSAGGLDDWLPVDEGDWVSLRLRPVSLSLCSMSMQDVNGRFENLLEYIHGNIDVYLIEDGCGLFPFLTLRMPS